MTVIRATCPTCEDVQLKIADVALRVCTDTSDRRYIFTCPACLSPTSCEIDSEGAELLVSAGVEIQWWSLPSEMKEVHSGPALTHDDLLSFHELLADDSALSRVVNSLDSLG